MAKKEVEHHYAVILAIVAVVAVVTLVLSGGSLLGAIIGNPITVAEENRISTCFDFDEANDPNVYGYTQVGVLKYKDYCDG